MEGLGTARLADEVPAGRAIATTVPRADILEALRDPEGIPELVLDLTWRVDDRDERSSFAVAFTQQDLEQLLAQPGDGGVVLTFDGEELARLFDDVEAHGLRERALVVAVAAAGAIGSSAAIANAMPMLEGSQSPAATAPAQVSDAASGGGYTAPAAVSGGTADRLVTDASSGGGYQALSGTDASVTDASSAGGYQGVSGTDRMVTDASSGGGYAAGGAADSMVTDVSSGGGYTAATAGTASATDAMRTDVSSAGGYGAGVGTTGELSGPMLHVSGTSTTNELLIGGAILAIAGAAFAARRQMGSARPA